MVMTAVRTTVLLMLFGFAQAAIAEVQVTIDRNPVQVNESFQLVFSLDHDPDGDPDFSTLLEHFLILGSNRGNSISIINGKYRRSVKWTLQLMAKQIGEYMIPAIRFGDERSKPFRVTVKPSSLAGLPHDDLIFEVIAGQPEAFVQSQIIVKLRLLSASNIPAYQFGDIQLRGVDAVIEPLGDVQDYQTRIADRTYLVLEQRFALFPQQAGRLGIAPIVAEVRLPSGSAFDPFQTGGKIRRVRSQAVHIDVKPIPAEASGAYWLPAGKIVLREEWSRLDQLVAGEPVTRSISIVADGLTSAQLPEIEIPPVSGLKQYPDQPGLQDHRSGRGISGIRSQKVALIPGAPGRYQLPEIDLRWWNLHEGRLETATIPSRELIVGGPAAPEPGIDMPAITATEAESIPPPPTGRFWVWLSLLLACGWALSAAFWWYGGRRQPAAPTADNDRGSLRRSRGILKQACHANDAAAARLALLAWGQALLAPRPPANLYQLGQVLGREFADEIVILNRSLYAAAGDAWQGNALWQLCRHLERRHRSDIRAVENAELAPLNP